MSDKRILLATTPVSWAADDGSSLALGADPVEWRQPSGVMLTTDGWADVGGGSEDDLDALRAEVDALVRLYFVADVKTFRLLSGNYLGGDEIAAAFDVKALYENYIGQVAEIANAVGEPAVGFEIEVLVNFYSVEDFFRNVFFGHDGESGWTAFWPDGTVDLMDEDILFDTARLVMELARRLVEMEGAAFAGTYLDWDVLMGTGEYPEVANLLGGVGG